MNAVVRRREDGTWVPVIFTPGSYARLVGAIQRLRENDMPQQVEFNPHYTREEYLHSMGVTPKKWHITDGPNGRRILADALLDDKEFVAGQTWASAFGLVTLAAAVNGYAVYTWTDHAGPHREQLEFWHFQRSHCLCVDGAHVPEKYREA